MLYLFKLDNFIFIIDIYWYYIDFTNCTCNNSTIKDNARQACQLKYTVSNGENKGGDDG